MRQSRKSCAISRNSWRSQIIQKVSTTKENQLVLLSKSFAVEVIKLNDSIRARGKSNAIVNQLLRCSTSIGANIHEANYASNRADFVNKMQNE